MLTGQSGISRQVFSDDMGRYQITELPRGRYSLSAVNREAPNLVADQADVDTGRGFQTRISVNLYLRQRSDETTESTSSPVVSTKEASQKVPKAAEKAFDEGVKAGSSQKLDKALTALSKAIELYPEYFQAFAERGHVRLAMGRPSEAAEDFSRALGINPVYGPALRGAGICKFEQGNYAEAVKDLESASSVEPNLGRTFLLLGVAYLSTNRPEAARSALARAVSVDPKGSTRAHVHLANLAIQENQPQEAIAQLDAYLADAPNAPDAEKVRALRKQLEQGVQKH
jgi:tetratricopeptide (TPR) repeat protein